MAYYPRTLTRSYRAAGGGQTITENTSVTSAKQSLIAEALGFRDPSGFVLSNAFPRTMKHPDTGKVLVASHPQAHHDYEAAGYVDQGSDIA